MADAVIVASDGPIDQQVRKIVGTRGVNYAVDPVIGEMSTQMFQALSDEGRMLVHGSLTGRPMQVGTDPRLIFGGHRVLEMFSGHYWVAKLDLPSRRRLFEEVLACGAKASSSPPYLHRAQVLPR